MAMETLDVVFCRLLQLALGLAQDFPYTLGEKEWRALLVMAQEQTLLGVAYNGIAKLPQGVRPPKAVAVQWSAAAESIRGANCLMNQEAARYTGLFDARGIHGVILKGQANARLYPDPFSRQPGDIDIWLPGGYEEVRQLLLDMGLIEGTKTIDRFSRHIGFRNEKGIEIEAHYRPAESRCRNKEYQKVLLAELEQPSLTPEGFYAPSIRFALLMQLAHLYCHCYCGGIGLRHFTDYCMLLMHATEADREFVWAKIKRFSLGYACAAVMGVMEKVFGLPREYMLCAPDKKRGTRLYKLAMVGGNFGRYDPEKKMRRFVLRRWLSDRKKALQWIPFDPLNAVLNEANYWKLTFALIPERIRRRKIAL